jgi:FlaA1/EpsC-like NDP-sugar epimerase
MTAQRHVGLARPILVLVLNHIKRSLWNSYKSSSALSVVVRKREELRRAHIHPNQRYKMCASNSNDHSNNKTVLVTGGCGYIGSHTIVVLLQNQYNVVVIDNCINSSSVSLDRVSAICSLSPKEREERLHFHELDLCNATALHALFESYRTNRNITFHSVIHFAGLKAVGESTRIPLKYYENNLIGTFHLLHCMEEFACHSLVFSSSATGTFRSYKTFFRLWIFVTLTGSSIASKS